MCVRVILYIYIYIMAIQDEADDVVVIDRLGKVELTAHL